MNLEIATVNVMGETTFMRRWLLAPSVVCMCVLNMMPTTGQTIRVYEERTGMDTGWPKQKEKTPTRLLASDSWSGPGWEQDPVELLSSLRLSKSCLPPKWRGTNLSLGEACCHWCKLQKADDMVQIHWMGDGSNKHIKEQHTAEGRKEIPTDAWWHGHKCLSQLIQSSTLVPFKQHVFTCFCLANYFVPLKSKGEKGDQKKRWLEQSGSLHPLKCLKRCPCRSAISSNAYLGKKLSGSIPNIPT